MMISDLLIGWHLATLGNFRNSVAVKWSIKLNDLFWIAENPYFVSKQSCINLRFSRRWLWCQDVYRVY